MTQKTLSIASVLDGLGKWGCSIRMHFPKCYSSINLNSLLSAPFLHLYFQWWQQSLFTSQTSKSTILFFVVNNDNSVCLKALEVKKKKGSRPGCLISVDLFFLKSYLGTWGASSKWYRRMSLDWGQSQKTKEWNVNGGDAAGHFSMTAQINLSVHN